MPKKPALFKHYINCKLPFVTPDFALDPIKKEATDGDEQASGNGNAEKLTSKKKKVAPNRRMTTQIVKSEVQIDDTSRDEAEAEEGEEIMTYEPEINYDGFQNDDDSDEEIPPNQMDSIVKMEKDTNPAVNIKQEKSSQSAIQQKINAMIRSIKQEAVETETNNSDTSPPPPLQRRIKAEKDEQGSIKLLNPLAMKNNKKPSTGKKVFKITPALLAKIKKEKIDREEIQLEQQQRDEAEAEDEDLFSAPAILKIKQEKTDERDEAKGVAGDIRTTPGEQHENVAERDEAEAEDEDLLNGMTTNATAAPTESADMRVKIKSEKMDSGYGDEVRSKPKKQLINPLAALRNAQKVNEEASNDKSLVISSVTSINQNENSNTAVAADPATPCNDDANNPATAVVESSVEALQLNNDATTPSFDDELDDLLRRCENTAATDGMSFDELLS